MTTPIVNMLKSEWHTIYVLWLRDVLRFWRQPSRLLGALGQPIIFWGVIGSGMQHTFVMPDNAVDYVAYFYVGVVMMVIVFASIFASVSVIEDRHQGFLQAVLAGPGSRLALVVGKTLGSVTVALLQASVFLLLMGQAGLSAGRVVWPSLVVMAVCASAALSSLGFAVAWALDNVQAYHAVQMTVLVPLWVVSGAMFPPSMQSPIMHKTMQLNPLAWAVTGLRHAFYGGEAPPGTTLAMSISQSFAAVAGFMIISLGLATWACVKKE